MQKTHAKKDDEVVVIAGADKGARGKVIEVLRAKDRVIVEGVRMIKKHVRKNQQNPQGAIIEREGSIHISNVMLASTYDARAVAKNPHDHPMGGGGGKTSGGGHPMTPWSKITKGYKTRSKRRYSDRFIVIRRNGKAMKQR